MLITGKSVIISPTIYSNNNELLWIEKGKKFSRITTFAEKKCGEKSQVDFASRFSLKRVVAQSVVGVLGLGFIDAGYSGDWSRIGVFSKQIEDLLKIAALFVVPLCLFFIFSFSNKIDE